MRAFVSNSGIENSQERLGGKQDTNDYHSDGGLARIGSELHSYLAI